MMFPNEQSSCYLERFVSENRHHDSVFGFEWGSPDTTLHLSEILNTWLKPQIAINKTVLEIGSGGGRWSQYFINNVACCHLVDGTHASETAIKHKFNWSGFQFHISKDGSLPAIPNESVDYVFSWDTFVHFPTQLFDNYIAEVGRILKPHGIFHLHYAYFSCNSIYNPQCFCYRSYNEVSYVLKIAELSLTGRCIIYPFGHGSCLIEAEAK